MNRNTAVRDAWHPSTREDREAVLGELERILASPHFCNSKRYPALLRYIVQNTLEGRSDLLKERTLGVDVFERQPSYDTNSDTVVRYTAGEVRKRLALYYHELDHKPAIQIALPPGSYIPEFHHADDAGSSAIAHEVDDSALEMHREPHSVALHDPFVDQHVLASEPGEPAPLQRPAASVPSMRQWWLAAAAAVVLIVAVLAGAAWRSRVTPAHTVVDEFWAPLVRDQRTVVVCSGGVVFKEGNFSGVTTAGKDIDYPFVSSQIAVSIAHVSALLEHNGVSTDLQFSASTPVTRLREQPLVMLGGYNNLWTLRLLDSMPLHFGPENDASIVDAQHPGVTWVRDQTKPYSSADDYALIARFRDTTTDSWVIVIAGLGRNGTEAAAQFVTSPRYMQQLKDKLGGSFSNRNIEAVLKVNVIEGKTGAPSLLTERMW